LGLKGFCSVSYLGRAALWFLWSTKEQQAKGGVAMAERTQTIPVAGMSCEHCVRAVTQALKSLAGVGDVQVSLAEGAATVTYDDALVGLEQLKAAIEEEGYRTQ
jgi:copper chaperone